MATYNDDEMYFDETIGKYVITYDAVERNLHIDKSVLDYFNANSEFQQFAKEMSEDIYRHILMHKFVFDRKYWLEEINTNEMYRPYIKRALLYQLRYAIRSGGNLLKDMHGIDLERARFVDMQRLRGDVGISPSSIEELKTGGLLNTEIIRNR